MVASVVFFLVILIGITNTEAVVTNEDIRVAILQIVNVVRATGDKLEKHEYRDRVLGEQLKKGLVNIDKRIKMLDPLKGTVGRLDERLAAVETILMQTNEREKMQLQRTYEAVIDIQKNLPVIMEEMKNEIISKISANEPPAQITEPVMSKKDFEKMEKEVMNKIDKVTNTIGKIENEISKIKTDNQQVKDLHNKSSDNLEKLKRHFNDSQQLLNKYDKKLGDYNSKTGNKENDEWKNNVIKALDGQKSSIKDISQDLKNLHGQVKQLPPKDVINKLQNSINNCQDASLKQALHKIEGILNKSHDESTKTLNVLTKFTNTFNKSLDNTNYAINSQKSSAKDILQNIKSIQNQLHKLPQIEELATSQRETNKKLEITMKNIDNVRDVSNMVVGTTNNILDNCSKTNNGLDSQKSLQEILNNVKNLQSQRQNIPQIDQLAAAQRAAVNKLDDAVKNIHGLTEVTATLMKSIANTNSALDVQKSNTQEILNNIKNVQNQLPQINELSAGQRTAINKLEDTLKNINGLTEITGTLMKSFANTNNALDLQKSSMQEVLSNIKNVQNHLPQINELSIGQRNARNTLENILKNINGLTEITGTLMKSFANTNNALNGQQSDVKEILIDVKNIQNKINQLPQRYDLDLHQNSSLQKLNQLSADVSVCKQQSSNEVRHILENIINNINKTHEDTIEKLNDLSEITAALGQSFVTNYDQIRNEIKGLNRLDQVMINTADGVIDTKRKVEFGVHQILAEISKYSKETTKHVQQAVSNRLDTFETSILDPDTGALANSTSKIEDDIQQVWRQIGIMYQQMSSNSEALKQLQNQTDAYITGSLGTMNNVKGKVGQITGRITEVDENLNYLIGRLSLVTEEFNRIKTGLSSALEKIKESFHAVQEKVDEGPGPHNIDSSEQVPPTA
uniref:Laminin subunit gamma-1-like n=1 Tax=Diabrotica virgifera virgifera TaxID=50390 RepID=A0A6P7G8A2_DIAVI